jgi:hypothetical protein
VFEQIDENGVEPFGLTILKIPRRFFFCQIRYQGPPCVALYEEWRTVLADQITMILADAKRLLPDRLLWGSRRRK